MKPWMPVKIFVAMLVATSVGQFSRCTQCESPSDSGELEHGLLVSNGVGAEPDQVLDVLGTDEVRGYLRAEVRQTSVAVSWHAGPDGAVRASAIVDSAEAFERFVVRVRRVNPMLEDLVIVVEDDVGFSRLIDVIDDSVGLGLRGRVLVDEKTGERMANAGG